MFSKIKKWACKNLFRNPDTSHDHSAGNSSQQTQFIDIISDIDRKTGSHFREAVDRLSVNDHDKATLEMLAESEGSHFIPIIPPANRAGFDIIGDIHGHADTLVALLGKLDYKLVDGCYHHKNRKAIFVGDYIDKGPDQVRTYEIVRKMVNAGHAMAIMGNHEFNAVCWATPDIHDPEGFLRPHTKRNYEQTKTFLDQAEEGSAKHREMLDWFSKLPLFLDLPDLRVVHACWSIEDIQKISPYLDRNNALFPESWQLIANESSPHFASLEAILKGPEIALPDNLSFLDDYGQKRTTPRIKWWAREATYKEMAMVPPSEKEKMPNSPVPGDISVCYDNLKPVFFGHYTLRGTPSVQNESACCVDFAVTDKKGTPKLCCYRWSEGDFELSSDNLVWVEKPL